VVWLLKLVRWCFKENVQVSFDILQEKGGLCRFAGVCLSLFWGLKRDWLVNVIAECDL